jgi:hypothetical protein
LGSSRASFAYGRDLEPETKCIDSDITDAHEHVCWAPRPEVSVTAEQLREDEMLKRQTMAERQPGVEEGKKPDEQEEAKAGAYRYSINLSGFCKHVESARKQE